MSFRSQECQNRRERAKYRKFLLLAVLLLLFDVGQATAQRGQGQTTLPPTVTLQEHKAEINVFGGYVWTWSISTYVNLNASKIRLLS